LIKVNCVAGFSLSISTLTIFFLAALQHRKLKKVPIRNKQESGDGYRDIRLFCLLILESQRKRA